VTAGSFRIRDLPWIIAGGPACWPLALQILRPAACEINLTTLPGCGCGCGAVRGHNFPLAYLVRLRQARLAAGLTRAQLARRADVTLYTVTKLEDGPAEPGWRVAGGVITALSRVLGVEPLWLTCQEPEDWADFPARVPPASSTANLTSTSPVGTSDTTYAEESIALRVCSRWWLTDRQVWEGPVTRGLRWLALGVAAAAAGLALGLLLGYLGHGQQDPASPLPSVITFTPDPSPPATDPPRDRQPQRTERHPDAAR
jgi:transcriptional regulator with XRE-family HTH domain